MPGRKPDDMPVTYGELRRAIKMVLDLNSQMTVYTARGLATALTTQPDTAARKEVERKEKIEEARLRDLAKKIEAEFGLDELL